MFGNVMYVSTVRAQLHQSVEIQKGQCTGTLYRNNKYWGRVLTGKARILILASFLAIVAFFIVDIALEFLFPLAHTKFGKSYRSSPRIGSEMSLSTAHNENENETDNLSNGNGLRVYGLRISLSDQHNTVSTFFTTFCANVTCPYV